MRIHSLNSIPIRRNPTIPYRSTILNPARARYPTHRLTMSRLNCRIGAEICDDTRQQIVRPKCNARNNCDRFFNSECFARRPAH